VTRREVAAAQGAVYVATGLWPLVDRSSFERVTGRKRDWWLVQTVGLLVASVGAGLVAAAASDRVTPELRGIAAGCAVSLAGIDVVHAGRGRLRPIYLLDAVAEAGLLAAWARPG
jgi:hypothetical protein